LIPSQRNQAASKNGGYQVIPGRAHRRSLSHENELYQPERRRRAYQTPGAPKSVTRRDGHFSPASDHRE
jgi:hypothetical protein